MRAGCTAQLSASCLKSEAGQGALAYTRAEVVDLELLESQLQRIGQRWPSIEVCLRASSAALLPLDPVSGRDGTFSVRGIQLSSRHKRRAEAALQRSAFGASGAIYLYGIGLGDLQRELLGGTDFDQVHVKIMNAAIFVAVLGASDQSDWISDPRVSLSLARDDEDIFEPFFVLPPELVLVEDDAWKVRDRLQTELNARHVFEKHRADDPILLERIAATRPWIERDRDVGELFGSEVGRPAYIFASGPSLEDHLDALAQEFANRPVESPSPLLISVDTAYRTLSQRGIKPHLVVTMDRHLTPERVVLPGSDPTSLVYFPLTDPGIVSAWRGPRFTAYAATPLYEKLRAELSRATLWSGGSVLHSAVDLAVLMGTAQVTLFGADFAFLGGKTHAGWESGELGKDLLKADYWVKSRGGERIRSSQNFASYLSELERYIRARPGVVFRTTTSRGALIARTEPDPDYYR